MILSDYVTITISNKKDMYFYNSFGYTASAINDIINVKVQDIPDFSLHKILVKCDYCDNTKMISKKTYNQNTKFGKRSYACSQKCSRSKNKETIRQRYGVDNISQHNDIKSKKIMTCMQNHGVEHPQMSKDIFLKSKETKLTKYKNSNFNNIEKLKKTMLEKYGVEFASMSAEIKLKQQKSLSHFLKNRIIDKSFYKSINIIDYQGNDCYILKCDLGATHSYTSHYKLIYYRYNNKTTLCTICNPISQSTSGKEISLLSFIKQNYNGTILTNNKSIIQPYELDIYLPDLKIAFEFNGLYWHSEQFKDKKYHLNKTEMCQKMGIHLIQIWEDDWDHKQDIVKSIILNKIGNCIYRIYARKCEIREVDSKSTKDFLNKNHLQGYCPAKYRVGLYYDNELVSLMTFGKLRKPLNSKGSNLELEMLRYCVKTNITIVGGASKLFNYAKHNIDFTEIVSYADLSYFDGSFYESLGFKSLGKSGPSYYYIVDNIKIHRFNFRKDKLVKLGYDSNKTEREIMSERGINRLWTSGNLKFKFTTP